MRSGVGSDRTSSILIGAAGALAAATVTATRVAGRATFPTADPTLLPSSIPFTTTVATTEALAERAASQLFVLLGIVGWGTLAVGLVTALALAADHAARARFEVTIHRAVGASRAMLLGAAVTWGLRLAGGALAIGISVGVVAGRLAGNPWGATWRGIGSALLPIAATVAGTLLLGAGLPLWAARTRGAVPIDEEPSPLGFASAQLGVSLALLVAGVVVIERTRVITSTDRAAGLDPHATIERVASTDGSPLDVARLLGPSQPGGRSPSASLPGGHLGLGAVDELITECGQCMVGGIFLRFRPLRATYLTASADTFDARGLAITEGRAFTAADREGEPPVAIVNRHLARRYFQDGQPLGRDVFLGGKLGGTRYRVVGVVDDRRGLGVGGGEQPLEAIYLSALQHPGTVAEVLVPPDAKWEPPAGTRLVATESVPAAIARATAPMRWFGRWFLATGAIALLLATAGVAALMILWVRSLRGELALRRAVGARRRHLVGLLLGGAIRTGTTGVLVAVTLFGPMLWPNLELVVPGTSLWQPAAFGWGALLLVSAALLGAATAMAPVLRATPADLASAR